MQKPDALVAGAGAVILLVALAGATLTGADVATYTLAPEARQLLVDDGNANHFAEGAYTDVFSFEVVTPGVTDLFVNVTLTFLPQGPASMAAAHATLTAPNGTAYTLDGVPGGSASQPAFSATFAVPAASAPAARSIEAGSVEEARALATAQAPRDALGNWTLEVSFSPGLQPATSSTLAWEAGATAWTWEPTPQVPRGR